MVFSFTFFYSRSKPKSPVLLIVPVSMHGMFDIDLTRQHADLRITAMVSLKSQGLFIGGRYGQIYEMPIFYACQNQNTCV